MLAPRSNRKLDTAETMPGPSGQEMSSRAVWSAPRAGSVDTGVING